MDKTFFALGAFLGCIGVAAGAFGAHALQARLSAEQMNWFELAARYQMIHALALIAAAWAAQRWPSGMVNAGGWLLFVGVLIFCGTLYAMAFGGPRILGAITPIGGLSLILGWLLLAVAVVRSPR
jgi:uncharacterized membrane protein YgdD (TMEM256/DUF423 family)